jgi:hypothetical protein
MNGAWKINFKRRFFQGKSKRPRLTDSQSPPVNGILQEREQVRSQTSEQEENSIRETDN